MAKKLASFYERRFSAFQKHYAVSLEEITEGAIHKLRVDIKKLKAILLVAELVERDSRQWNSYAEGFLELFNSAGELRELQVSQVLVNTLYLSCDSSFSNYLRRREAEAKKQLQEDLRQFELASLNHSHKKLLSILQNASDNEVVNLAAAYVFKSLKKVARKYGGPGRHSRLHKIRIRLRRVAEMLNLLCEIGSSKALVDLKSKLNS